MTDLRCAADELRALATAALVRAGAGPAEAGLQADVLTEAEMRGHPSHGVRRVPVLVERLRAGLIDPAARPVLDWSTPSVVRVDGRNGFGPVVGFTVVDALVERASTTGVAVAALHRTHHLGMLAPYVERMVAGGCAGIVLTTSEALVHPWGGRGALVGTNPIGIGIPRGDEPLILDMSTGATSAGKVRDYAARGQALPEGWAVDAEGVPTTDAAAAVAGAISPFGGPKGYALGVAFEMLVAALTGTSLGTDVAGTLDSAHPVTKGDIMIALSVDAFAGDAVASLTAYVDALRASAGDGATVDVPGDRSRRARAAAAAGGVVVDRALWRTLMELAGEEAA